MIAAELGTEPHTPLLSDSAGRSDVFRALVIDDVVAIHEDFVKVLDPPDSPDDALDALEAELLGNPRKVGARARFLIDSAFQGEEGILRVQRAFEEGDPYSVVFVDVQMPPGLNGIDTLARIWAIDPRIQAVICTAYSDKSWEDMVGTLGKTDGMLVLRKPFDPIEVLQIAHALAYKWILARQVERQLANLEHNVAERTRHLEAANARLRLEIQSRQDAENALRHLALHDTLTGLPNRILFKERLDQAITRAQRGHIGFAVLMIDLDHFKDVNDLYGHAAGDQLLCEIAGRLSGCLRRCDTLARLGGDEFVILLEGIETPEGAAIVAQRLLDACTRAVEIGAHHVHTPPSIGIAVYPLDATDAEMLLKCADLAMYDAKNNGRASFRFYAEEMKVSTIRKLELRNQLGLAVDRQEFTLHYQPLTDLTTGAITGMEALVRWQSPEYGLVPPLHFIPVAETCGLIVPLGLWVLRTACEQLAEWHAAGMPELSMAVNVSVRQLRSPGFLDEVRRAMSDFGIPPWKLEIEITESAAMADLENATQNLVQLAELGVRIVIDDFGSGYSSFARLKELPIHCLKVDRLFLKNIADDPRDAAIVLAIVGMAHSLDIQVVAEGIETPEQLEALRKVEGARPLLQLCDRVQGYLFGRPQPASVATTLLRDQLSRGAESPFRIERPAVSRGPSLAAPFAGRAPSPQDRVSDKTASPYAIDVGTN